MTAPRTSLSTFNIRFLICQIFLILYPFMVLRAVNFSQYFHVRMTNYKWQFLATWLFAIHLFSTQQFDHHAPPPSPLSRPSGQSRRVHQHFPFVTKFIGDVGAVELGERRFGDASLSPFPEVSRLRTSTTSDFILVFPKSLFSHM